MFYHSVVKENYLSRWFDKVSLDPSVKNAWVCFLNGDFEKGHLWLDPLVNKKHPISLVVSSFYSKPGENEENFYRRHIEQLMEACSLGDPVSEYCLAVYLEIGDFFEADADKSRELYKSSSSKGFPPAEFIVGTMLLYGTGGEGQNIDKGFELLKNASDQGVAEATELLNNP